MAIGVRLSRAGRHIARYREIITVLVRYGLADWAHRVEFDFAREILQRGSPRELLNLSTEERIRLALIELGPTFIKFGQILSVRPDIAGIPLSEELKKLQADVDADPYDLVKNVIESELGKSVEDVFDKFEPKAVASGSIGQVHVAWLKTGEKVAVKVRHPGIEKMIATDMEILLDIASFLESYVEESRHFRPKETVAQFARTLTREMDFQREARNIANLADDLSGDPSVKIPKVYDDLTSSKTLVMEWLDGTFLSRPDELLKKGVDLQRIAEKVARIYLAMIFGTGFYHADPHPGNILVTEDGKVALLDFGMAGRLSARIREYIEELVPAVISGDSDRLVRIIVKIGSLPPDFDQSALGTELADFISYYGAIPVASLRLSDALNEAISIIHRRHIILPAEAVMLMKTLVTLEGTNRALEPKFSLVSLIKPYERSFGAAISSPLRKLNKARRMAESMRDFLEYVPPAMVDILERFRKETLEIHMEHRGLEHSANRLVFGILTAALFVGSSMVLSAGVPPKILGLSALGMLGYAVSLFMGLRILWAIMVSGRLE
ncbi:MAG: phosphotransferase [Nitrospinae bacterium]|nr:phosphotransferase [Nitrospinota bacterium]